MSQIDMNNSESQNNNLSNVPAVNASTIEVVNQDFVITIADQIDQSKYELTIPHSGLYRKVVDSETKEVKEEPVDITWGDIKEKLSQMGKSYSSSHKFRLHYKEGSEVKYSTFNYNDNSLELPKVNKAILFISAGKVNSGSVPSVEEASQMKRNDFIGLLKNEIKLQYPEEFNTHLTNRYSSLKTSELLVRYKNFVNAVNAHNPVVQVVSSEVSEGIKVPTSNSSLPELLNTLVTKAMMLDAQVREPLLKGISLVDNNLNSSTQAIVQAENKVKEVVKTQGSNSSVKELEDLIKKSSENQAAILNEILRVVNEMNNIVSDTQMYAQQLVFGNR